jgi:hypothetical protein
MLLKTQSTLVIFKTRDIKNGIFWLEQSCEITTLSFLFRLRQEGAIPMPPAAKWHGVLGIRNQAPAGDAFRQYNLEV